MSTITYTRPALTTLQVDLLFPRDYGRIIRRAHKSAFHTMMNEPSLREQNTVHFTPFHSRNACDGEQVQGIVFVYGFTGRNKKELAFILILHSHYRNRRLAFYTNEPGADDYRCTHADQHASPGPGSIRMIIYMGIGR
jgi:hypothetical protein